MTVGFDPETVALALTPRRPLTEDTLRDALEALGDTPGRVADTLHAGGHRGSRGCPGECPVAHYLLSVWPDLSEVDVTADTTSAALDGEVVCIRTPAAVGAFVGRFDTGMYADLDRDEELG